MQKFYKEKIKKPYFHSFFVGQMVIFTEDTRKLQAYSDVNFISFYYWLGTTLTPKNILDIGFDIGILSGVFLKSCKTVENFYLYSENPTRIGVSNIKKHYKNKIFIGNLEDFHVKFDLILLNQEDSYDKMKYFLEFSWQNLEIGGSLIIEYLSNSNVKRAITDFCKIKNRNITIIGTRYSTGILRR